MRSPPTITKLMSSYRELPVELWKEIFEFAIGESWLLDPLYEPQEPRTRLYHTWNSQDATTTHSHQHSESISSLSSILDNNNHMNARRGPRLLEPSLHTKLAIVATSSQWRKMGLPYLFRAVTFTSLRQLQLLTGLVRASRYRYVPAPGPQKIRILLEGKGTGYGVMIRRILTKIDLGRDPSDHIIYADILSDLLKCCPNLRIYVNQNIQAGLPTPAPIINALSDIGSRKAQILPNEEEPSKGTTEDDYLGIERLEWSGKESLIVGDLTFLLRTTPYLRKLVLGPVFLCSIRLSDTLSEPSISLVHLQSIHMDMTSLHRAHIRYTRRWLIPSLRHLQVLIGFAPWQSDLLFFLDAAGSGLESLHLRVADHCSMTAENWSDILTRCLKISSLSFNVAAMPVLSPSIVLPELRSVGLEGCLPDFRATNEYDRPESDRREQLEEHLSALIARNTTLRVIQMLDDEFLLISGKNAQGYGTTGWEVPRRKKLSREFRTWKEWSSNLRVAGISLENCEGDAIGLS
ncbi:hypothetical protein FRC17_010678 [Serendipita sp. 399]|nr:hypothetical protein FRC17_010678 [Serendipita sp. 399]